MKLSKESQKHLNRLCESIVRRYEIADRDQLREVVQKELCVTLDRVLDSNSLVSADNDCLPADGVFMMTAPLNTIFYLKNNNVDNKVSVLLKTEEYLDTPSMVTDKYGAEFLNTLSVMKSNAIEIGTLTMSGKNMSFRVADSLSPDYIDVGLYAQCWNTERDADIQNFLNDIYDRVYKKGVHTVDDMSLTSKPNDFINHISYSKLLRYAKSLYPAVFGNEGDIMASVLSDLVNMDIAELNIDRDRDTVTFSISCDDKNQGIIDEVNRVLELYV